MDVRLIAIIKEIDSIDLEDYFPSEKESILGKFVKKFEEEKEPIIVQKLRTEWMLLNNTVGFVGRISDKWSYILQNINKRPDFWLYDSDTIKYFEERLSQIPPNIAAARINYYLWTATNDIKYAEGSIKLFIDSGLKHSKVIALNKMPEFCFDMAFRLLRSLNKNDLIKRDLLPSLDQTIKNCENNKRSYVYRSLLELFISIGSFIWSDLDASQKSLMEDAVKKCLDIGEILEKEGNLDLANAWLGFAEKFYTSTNETTLTEILRKRILSNMIQMGDRHPYPLIKLTFYEAALKYMINNGIIDEKIKESLSKQISDNHHKSETYFKEVKTEVTIEKSDIENELRNVIGTSKETSDIIKKLSAYIIPSFEYCEKLANENTRNSIVSMLPIVRHGSGYISKFYSTENERLSYEIMTQIGLYLQMKSIIVKHGLDFYKIDSEILGNIIDVSLLDGDSKKIIKQGVERHFEKDYISSIHILAFQIEELIRKTMVKNGQSNFIFDQQSNSVRQRLLESLIRHDSVVKFFGNDFCKSVESFASNPNFHNIRNNVGHGLAKIEDLNEKNSIILLFLNLYIITHHLTN